jgi:hypothetical protein
VINFLNRGGEGEGEGLDPRLAATTAWVSAGTSNLPQSSIVRSSPVEQAPERVGGSSEEPLGGQWRVVDGHIEGAIEALACRPRTPDDADSTAVTDEALVDLLEDFDLGSLDQ